MRTMLLIAFAFVVVAPDRVAGAAAQSDSSDIALQETLRIGGKGEASGFRSISAVARSGSGDWYVADASVPEIRRFSATGDLLGLVGRPGDASGEFRAVDGLSVTSEGQLVVWDATNKRVSVFGEGGDFVRDYPVERGVRDGRSFAGSADGTLYLWRWVGADPVETPDGLIAEWVRVAPSGRVSSLRPVPLVDRAGPTFALSGRGGYFRPFPSETLSAMGANGAFYVGRNDRYRIRHHWPDGTQTLLGRDEPAIRLTKEELSQWEDWADFFAARAFEDRSAFLPIPRTKPYFRDLLIDDAGRLWVSRYTDAVYHLREPAETLTPARRNAPGFEWRDAPRWDLFSPSDVYCGSVILPFDTELLGADGDVAWGVQESPGQGEYLVVWDLRLPEPSADCGGH